MDFEKYIVSYSFDFRLAEYDLKASIAHASMLAAKRIISKQEGKRIIAGLNSILKDLSNGKKLPYAEDVHYAIEKALYKKIGRVAGKLHTARSRNDQVVTATRLYLKDHADIIIEGIKGFQKQIVKFAEKNLGAIMPGYTHLQPGQPVLFSHHMLAYAWKLQRDKERIVDAQKRLSISPLGAAALAGTSFPIDRVMTAAKLGFSGVMENSIDAVSDRDFIVEFLAAASIMMAHISRLSEEFVIWANPSFGFVNLGKGFSSGSSIMPQKQNPDSLEILRAKCGRVYGNLLSVLTMLKSQPLAYNRDLQEDKPPLFDTVEIVEASLAHLSLLVKTIKINKEKMFYACSMGYMLATDVADALVQRGMPFREAHGIVKKVVAYAANNNLTLATLPIGTWKKFSPVFGHWIYSALSVKKSVKMRNSRGGTSPKSVKQQVRYLKRLIK